MEKEASIPTRKTLLGVPYDHYRMADGADLYVTPFGRHRRMKRPAAAILKARIRPPRGEASW